jgi:signal peptide peptidase SppA
MKSYAKIINGVNSSIWAILPDKMDQILAILRNKVLSVEIEGDTEIDEITAEKRRATPYRNISGNIASLQIYGTIAQRFSALESGGTTTEQIGSLFDQAINDPNVGAVVLDIDSPGGSVYGVSELAKKIFDARGKKPIIAVCNSLMASAAYWIGSAADQIVVTPSGEIGSIGVLAVHVDDSEADAKAGVKTTVFRSTEHKGEGIGPLSEDSMGYMQKRVMEYHSMFVNDIARNRDTKAAKVDENYGKGRVMGAEVAVSVGMADRVATFEQVIDDLRSDSGKKKKLRAQVDLMKIR